MPRQTLLRFERMDDLIARKCTGTPLAFANKLNISESTMYEYINILKERGAPIDYEEDRQTYFYKEEGKFNFLFKKLDTPV